MNDGNGQLKSYIERLETIEGHRRANVEDFKDVLAEAKSNGFEPKALRAIVKLRFEDTDKREKRQEYETILETYMAALGLLADTPLGKAAIASSPSIKRALDKFGTPVPLTDDERAKGQTSAFVDKSGARTSIGVAFAKT